MNKFRKRLTKISKHHESALVVGEGFGNLEEILSIYNTVFVINDSYPTIRAKNLVYRQDTSNLNMLTNVHAVFFRFKED